MKLPSVKLVVVIGAAVVLVVVSFGAYKFVIVPRENPVAEYYVAENPEVDLMLHLVQNNSKLSGTFEELTPTSNASGDLGGVTLLGKDGHPLGPGGCGELCVIDVAASADGQLSGSNLSVTVTSSGLLAYRFTCVFALRGQVLEPTPGDPCNGQLTASDGPPTTQPLRFGAASAQGAADARQQFFAGFQTTTQAWHLWNTAQALRKSPWPAENPEVFGLTNTINGYLNALKADIDPCGPLVSYGYIGPYVDDVGKSLDGERKVITDYQTSLSAFVTQASKDRTAQWYLQNTNIKSEFSSQIASLITTFNGYVASANAALAQLNANQPTDNQIRLCGADLTLHAFAVFLEFA